MAGPELNKPASGSYGEKKAIDDLKQALPTAQPSGPSAPQPAQPQMGTAPPQAPSPTRQKVGRPTGSPLPPGVPEVLASPTTQPYNQGLKLGASAPTAAPSPQHLMMLDMMANDPNVRPATRKWAQHVLKVIQDPNA